MIYLDYNATTPADARVVEAMLPYFSEVPGNAASVDHAAGHAANLAVEKAREQVARLVGAQPDEVIFTSGATEADNLAVLGVLARASDDAEVIVSAIEHPAVLEAAQQWGDRLRVVPVDSQGLVDPDAIRQLISPRTALVSVMVANNETGVVQDLEAIGRVCAQAQVPLHSDAVQAGARLSIDASRWQASMISLSAHKMYGPKGVGALIRRSRPRVRLGALHYGGGHERGLRSGTLNVPGIVGFGVAAQLCTDQIRSDAQRERALKRRLHEKLLSLDLNVEINGPTADAASLGQTLSIQLPGVDSQAMLRLLAPTIAVSSGSACSTTAVEPSHVLLAMGHSAARAHETLRISFGRQSTEAELLEAAAQIGRAAAKLRSLRTAA